MDYVSCFLGVAFSEFYIVNKLLSEGSRSKCNISKVECLRTNCTSLKQFKHGEFLKSGMEEAFLFFSFGSCLNDLGAWNL